MKFSVSKSWSFLFLAVNQLQKTESSVYKQSLREKHAFSVEFLLVYRSVLRWRSNTHVVFPVLAVTKPKGTTVQLESGDQTHLNQATLNRNIMELYNRVYTRRGVRKTATFVFDSGNSTLTAWQVSDTNTLVSSDQSVLDVNGGTFGSWVWVSRLDFQRKYSQNEKYNLKSVLRLAKKGWKTKFLALRVV